MWKDERRMDDHLFDVLSTADSVWALSFCMCVCLFNKLHTREIFYDSRPACLISSPPSSSSRRFQWPLWKFIKSRISYYQQRQWSKSILFKWHSYMQVQVTFIFFFSFSLLLLLCLKKFILILLQWNRR